MKRHEGPMKKGLAGPWLYAVWPLVLGSALRMSSISREVLKGE